MSNWDPNNAGNGQGGAPAGMQGPQGYGQPYGQPGAPMQPYGQQGGMPMQPYGQPGPMQPYGQPGNNVQMPSNQGFGAAPINIVMQNVNNSGGLVRTGNRSKGTAVILAFLLGGLGAHKFYLGRTGMGVLYLLFCWTFIPAMVAFVETIMLALMSDQEFDLKFNSSFAR